MELFIPLFILILISAIFIFGVARYGTHKCKNHQLYFEDHTSRGTYCALCSKLIDEEFFIPKK